ncbi:DegV family protein [Streptosporangium sp. KLBMP 9127]|nr:DegV family protein [Streptosporangium sp. KLBMP 9127]
MPPPVAVVTDSTSYLPQEEAVRLGITVVPLQVVIGGRPYEDVAETDTGSVTAELGDRPPITTSRPSPRRFHDVYEAAAAAGCGGVVSIHLSGEMSGTVEAARLAARDASLPVEVIDSRSIAMGLGFAVLAAAGSASRGGTLAEVTAAAHRQIDATRSFFYVDTLDHLRRGGRIGAAATLVGSALMIKPLLHIEGGAIVPLEKVRTAAKAVARLEDLAVQAASTELVAVAVQHLSARAKADALAERLARRLPQLQRLEVVEVGAVIGVHVGPGMLGVTVTPSLPSSGT